MSENPSAPVCVHGINWNICPECRPNLKEKEVELEFNEEFMKFPRPVRRRIERMVKGGLTFEQAIEKEIVGPEIVKKLVPPHKKVSRIITEADIPRVVEESVTMYKLCFLPVGKYISAYAVAESQINDTDPIRMFVTHQKKIVINPVILSATPQVDSSNEGCLTFPERELITVRRPWRIEVEYQTIMTDPEDSTKFTLSSKIKETVEGQEAFVFGHEIDHLDGKYIYNIINE